MRQISLVLLLVAALAASASSPQASATSALPRLTAAEEAVLTEIIEQHRRVQARFSYEDQDLLGRLTALVKQRMFATPLSDDLMRSATQVVSQIIPELTPYESATLAEYSLAGIASDTSIGPTAIDSQAQFNQQMITLQMAMQRENTMFTSVSNVLKTRHDTAKNSISNVR